MFHKKVTTIYVKYISKHFWLINLCLFCKRWFDLLVNKFIYYSIWKHST